MTVIRRRCLYEFVVVVALVVAGTFLLATWIGSLTPGITQPPPLWITTVQFEKDCLNITVENTGTQARTINEVKVYQSSNPYASSEYESNSTYVVHESILAGEQILICINFNWASGYGYKIELMTTDGKIVSQSPFIP
jgi:hypothetical protein